MTWTKASDQMPPKGVSVLATNGQRRRVAHVEEFYGELYFVEDGQDGYSFEDATHWAPLLEMPKTEREKT
jgi:hypothetical protein